MRRVALLRDRPVRPALMRSGTTSRASRPCGPKLRCTSPLSWRSITMPIRREPKAGRRPRLRRRVRRAPSSSARARMPLLGAFDTSSSPRAGRPARDRLPYLLALVASSCSAEESAKDGSGSRNTSGPVERDAVEVRREQHAQQILQRGRSPAALGDEPVRIRKRQHARFVFGREVARRCASCARSARTARAVARTDCRSDGAVRGSSARGAGRPGGAGSRPRSRSRSRAGTRHRVRRNAAAAPCARRARRRRGRRGPRSARSCRC